MRRGSPTPRSSMEWLVRRHFVTVSRKREMRPGVPMGELLPALLAQLSEEGKGLLVEEQGLCLANVGVELVGEDWACPLLSNLIAGLRHGDRDLMRALGIRVGLPCIYDFENKRLVSIIPIQIGSGRLVGMFYGRVLRGSSVFRDLVWALWGRYAMDDPLTTATGLTLATGMETLLRELGHAR